MTRIWLTDRWEILPRRSVPVFGAKRKDGTAPILFHAELMCQHPGSMFECEAQAERARRHWLKYGDPEMPAGDVFGFGSIRRSVDHSPMDEAMSNASASVLGSLVEADA